MSSYRDLEIWALAREMSIEIHEMTFQLPKFEMFEAGQQIRRSSKSTRSNIVEGYGRRAYKREFIKFVIYSLASNDETIDHLDTLFETGSLQSKEQYELLREKATILGKKLNLFLQSLERNHRSGIKKKS
jgi:four helix bundle protein